jgi:hypothetical protein
MRDTPSPTSTVPSRPGTPSPERGPSGARSRRVRAAAVAALACTGALAAGGVPAANAADATPTVLDAQSPVAVDVLGQQIAWLRPTSKPTSRGAVKTAQAVVLDAPGGTPRTLPATLPDYPSEISLGTDASDRAVLLVTTRSGVYRLRADGTGKASKLAGQTSRDDAPVMRAGRIAFFRTTGKTIRVRTATAPGRTSRVLYTLPSRFEGAQLALGAKGAVAINAFRPADVGIGDIVWLARPGKSVLRLTSQSYGGASDNGIGAIGATADGKRFNVSRWNAGGGHPSDVQRFSAASGKRTFVRKAPSIEGAEAITEHLLDDGKSAITAEEDLNCLSPGETPAPNAPAQPACIGLDLAG